MLPVVGAQDAEGARFRCKTPGARRIRRPAADPTTRRTRRTRRVPGRAGPFLQLGGALLVGSSVPRVPRQAPARCPRGPSWAAAKRGPRVRAATLLALPPCPPSGGGTPGRFWASGGAADGGAAGPFVNGAPSTPTPSCGNAATEHAPTGAVALSRQRCPKLPWAP